MGVSLDWLSGWLPSGRSGAAGPPAPPDPERPLPVVWLLGKTGAGKSSLVRALTGLTEAEIGNGYAPCTRFATRFDLPPGAPVLRFLDTRGLGEAGYDPSEDLAAARAASHLILAVARLDDPVQGEVAAALAAVRRADPGVRVLVAHSGADLVADPDERARARAATQARFERAMGRALPCVELTLAPAAPETPPPGLEQLAALLGEAMPEVALLLAREGHMAAEPARWAAHRAEVLRFAGAAGAADVAPLVGGVAVASLQVAMLRRLASRYEVEWSSARLAEFVAALGSGIALGFGASFGLRQAVKLIPVVGQTAGAAASGALSFAATYALGRAAAYYLHAAARDEAVSAEALRALYEDALRRGPS